MFALTIASDHKNVMIATKHHPTDKLTPALSFHSTVKQLKHNLQQHVL